MHLKRRRLTALLKRLLSMLMFTLLDPVRREPELAGSTLSLLALSSKQRDHLVK